MKRTLKTALLLFILIAAASLSYGQKQERYSRAKIYLSDNGHSLRDLSALGLAVDHGESKKGVSFTSDFSKTEIDLARKAGFKVDIVIDDVVKYYQKQNKKKAQKTTSVSCDRPSYPVPSHFHLGSYGGFFTYAEMLSILDSMHTLYPGLISVKQNIDTFRTIEGRPIYWVRVSNNPGVDQPAKPQMLYTSVHHAREPGSMSSNIFYLWYLLENYSTDPQVKTIIDNTELYFVLCMNPDGYLYNQTMSPGGGGLWRKNRRDNHDGTFGVDLNRNYGYKWAYDAIGSSPSTSSETYRGSSAFSEPETRAIKWFTENHHFKFALNYHTFSNDVIFPWSYVASLQAMDSDLHVNYWNYLTRFNHYQHGTSDQTVGYITNGDSDDWMYGDTAVKPKVFAFTPEIGLASLFFYPPATEIIPNCQDNLFPNLTLASFLLPFASITSEENKIETRTTGFLNYKLQRLGFVDTATYTVNIISLDSRLTVSATPKTYAGLTMLQEVYDSISYNLLPATPNGQMISYVLQVYNGQYYIRDTVSFYYGKYYSILAPSTNTLTEWSNTGWGLSTANYFSSPASIHSNLSGIERYDNNADITITANAFADLTHAIRAYMQFHGKWFIENNSDYCTVNVGLAGMGTFSPVCGKYTKVIEDYAIPIYNGINPNWVLEEIDLGDNLGQKINIMFDLVSDSRGTNKGFFFDDFSVIAIIDSASTIIDSHAAVRPLSKSSSVLTTYPNPSSNQIFVSINGYRFNEPMMGVLYDCTGRIAMEFRISRDLTTVDVASLPGGVYYLKVYDNGKMLPVQKVEVLR